MLSNVSREKIILRYGIIDIPEGGGRRRHAVIPGSCRLPVICNLKQALTHINKCVYILLFYRRDQLIFVFTGPRVT